MPTYYRVQPAHRDPAAMIGRHNVSRPWTGDDRVECPDCHGEGCERCRFAGDVLASRRGVSCCASIDDLRAYFSGRIDAEQMEGDVIVVLEGEESEDRDYDAHHRGSPVLVHPTRIVEIIPDAIGALGLGEL